MLTNKFNTQFILGESIPDDHEITIILPPDYVQKYADALKQKYKDQPIVVEEWPPRVGKNFFGRLTLIEGHDLDKKTASQKNWHMLRGQIDEIPNTLGHRDGIKIEDLLKTGSYQIPKIVVDGPPGIGKTTLCQKLLNMWSNGVLDYQYDLVLFCPLRNSKVAEAKKLNDLFVYHSDKVKKVVKWISDNEGKGVLIIFDGWDELSDKLRESSLVTSIIRNDMLAYCSVIVTSRSYASASLSALPSINKRIQVIGFSVKEISTVVIKTLQKDSTLADNLIDENKYNSDSFFKTIQYNEDSQLAVKLVNDLKVRGDVQSLCYIPMVCSMVILVYWKEGQLPTTLTQLYENFILLTIKRHIKRKHQSEADTEALSSLDELPLQLPSLFKNLCQLAYTNLAATKLTFSLHQSHQFLTEAAKEDYLGLLTKFRECDEDKYQFLHLSIQEFLAAWWIVKYDNTETKFNNYFHNEHFKMCLRFVAGLNHLENESYRQYFNRGIDLQCKKLALRKFETSHNHWFYEYLNSSILEYEYQVRIKDLEELQVLFLQLLYESQNTKLCQLFADSMKGHSLCLKCNSDDQIEFIKLALFDWLCLGYFISSSSIKWNQLDLGQVNEQSLSVFNTGLSGTSQSQCTKMILHLLATSNTTLVLNFLKKPLLQNIQHFIFNYSQCDTNIVLLELFNLSQLKMLQLICSFNTDLDETSYTSKCTELEQRIKRNSKLQELIIRIESVNTGKYKPLALFITSIIGGITQNKIITSFTLKVCGSYTDHFALADGILENLLRHNNTLQALSINILDRLIPLPVNRIKVKSKLTALEIRGSTLMNSLLPCIEGLECLILPMLYPPCLIFDSHPNLQQLTIQLDTTESINELFTILQTNTTLKALRVEVEVGSVYTICSIGTHGHSSYQDNINYKKCMSASSYMSIITDGITPNTDLQQFIFLPLLGITDNTGLQQLSIPVFLPLTNKEIKRFLYVITQTYITELEVRFQLDQTCSFKNDEKEMMKTFFYEQTLPDIFNMLRSHRTIKTMSIVCEYLNESSDTNTTEIMDLFCCTPFPSLEQLEIKRTISQCMIMPYTKNTLAYHHVIREVKMHIH